MNIEDCFKYLRYFQINLSTYEEHSSKLVVVQSSNHSLMKHIVTPLSIELSKFPGLINVINFIHYFLVFNDLQYKVALIDIEPWKKKDKYITYEPGRKIYHLNHEDINVNVSCDPNIQVLQTSNYYLYMFILIVTFVCIFIKILVPAKKIWFKSRF